VCAAGTAGSHSATSPAQCAQCTAGRFASAGSTRCGVCAIGKYASAGADKCANCPSFTVAPAAGSANCTRCPAGKVVVGGLQHSGFNDRTISTQCASPPPDAEIALAKDLLAAALRCFGKNFTIPAGSRGGGCANTALELHWSGGKHATVHALFGPQTTPHIKNKTIVVANPLNGCSALKNTNLKGKVALIRRGTCTFAAKAKNAQAAGAVAVVIFNNHPIMATAMTGTGNTTLDTSVKIPAVKITTAQGLALQKAAAESSPPTVSLVCLPPTKDEIVRAEQSLCGWRSSTDSFAFISCETVGGRGAARMIYLSLQECGIKALPKTIGATTELKIRAYHRRPLPPRSLAALPPR